MRVLYFTRGYTAHDHRFLAALGRTEHQVHYMRLERSGCVYETRPLPARIREVDWRGRRSGVRWADVPALSSRLRRVLSEVQPDLVHAGPVQQAAFLTAMVGFHPLLTMSWGSDLLVEARRAPGRQAARYTLARTDCLVCDCQTVRQAAEGLGMDPERIVAFPWGVDLQHFSPGNDGGLRHRLGWKGDFVLLSTRSWEPIYGLDVLVRGFVYAARANPRVRLLMLGDGSLGPWIRSILQESRLLEKVHFPGQVGYEDLPAYYRASDLYVSASRSDGSSISLLEAMASGLPTVVSDIPGNREWVAQNVNGWWFQDGDPRGLEEAIQAAAETQGGLEQIGEQARAVAEARADWSANFRELLRAYDMAAAMQG